MTDVDGVRAYRKNGRSVEGLTEEELADIMERFPRSSDAHMKASNQLQYYHELEEQTPIPNAPAPKTENIEEIKEGEA